MQSPAGNKGPDVILEVLEDCLLAFPVSSLLISLYKQYQQRGFLTKKQLQGLHAKASQIPDMNPGRLATLEAIIKKLPNRFKSEAPKPKHEEQKDPATAVMLQEILSKYPQHKRILFLKSKYDNNEPLTPADITDLTRIHKLIGKQTS